MSVDIFCIVNSFSIQTSVCLFLSQITRLWWPADSLRGHFTSWIQSLTVFCISLRQRELSVILYITSENEIWNVFYGKHVHEVNSVFYKCNWIKFRTISQEIYLIVAYNFHFVDTLKQMVLLLLPLLHYTSSKAKKYVIKRLKNVIYFLSNTKAICSLQAHTKVPWSTFFDPIKQNPIKF